MASLCEGYDDDDFIASQMCCNCGGGIGGTEDSQGYDEDCEDTHGDFVDSYGDGCDWYDYAPQDCGHYDTDDFHSNEMCCGCIRFAG